MEISILKDTKVISTFGPFYLSNKPRWINIRSDQPHIEKEVVILEENPLKGYGRYRDEDTIDQWMTSGQIVLFPSSASKELENFEKNIFKGDFFSGNEAGLLFELFRCYRGKPAIGKEIIDINKPHKKGLGRFSPHILRTPK